MASNFGATYLDVVGGMELAKANQRRDQAHEMGLEDRQRQIKRDGIAMEAAQFGLDSARSNQKQAEATRAANAPIEELKRKVEEAELSYRNAQMPSLQRLDKAKTDAELKAMSDRSLAAQWQLFRRDKRAGIESFNQSQAVAPGVKFSGSMESPDGKYVMFVGEDGKPIENSKIDVKVMDEWAAGFEPSDVKVMKSGDGSEQAVRFTKSGKSQVLHTTTAKPPDPIKDRFVPTEDGGSFNTTTGVRTPGSSGPGLGGTTGPKLDQRVAKATAAIAQHFGGQFDAMGQMSLKPGTEQMVTDTRVLAEQKIKSGMDPMAAAKAAIEEVQRNATMKGLTAPPTSQAPAAAGPVNWRDFVKSDTPIILQ